MANISFRSPEEIEDPQCRQWLEDAMAAGKPGPEFQSIRSHVPGVMRSFTKTREWIYHSGVLEYELKELLRAYIALSGDCTYCSNQGVARTFVVDEERRAELLAHREDTYSNRERLAMEYADAIMWNPAEADAALWARLKDEFSEAELVELGYWIGFTFGGQRWLKTLDAHQGDLAEAIGSKVAGAATDGD